jgi:type IV pilus assembly protein PilB
VTSTDDLVLQLAVERGRLSRRDWDAARTFAATVAQAGSKTTDPAAWLVAEGVVTWRMLAELAAGELGLECIALGSARPAAEVLAALPHSLARKHRAVPLSLDGRRLRVALGDPLDPEVIDTLTRASGLSLETAVAPRDEVEAAIERWYGEQSTAPIVAVSTERGEAARRAGTLAEASATDATDAPIIQLVEHVIAGAIARRASDIHWEPLEARFRVRYRIDGVLVEVESLSKRLQAATVSRLKLMANISIAEKRVPQDGRAHVTLGGKAVDLRVSSLPTVHGESIVMRILDQEGLRIGLAELGLRASDRQTFEQILALPDGLVLVTGPTGSGKTTTLYTCLHQLNRPDRKIITVEDPIEYRVSGINQVPVRHDVGMTFASALRAMLRQAPNVIMLGEIRDRETAENAINASLTGHLVFSTLHTNDAPGAVTRLIDLGVKPFLLAAALRAVVAQRLVRRVCARCARADTPTNIQRRALGLPGASGAEPVGYRRGDGCANCHGTGYRGRFGVFEILTVDEDLQRLIQTGASTAKLREAARERGMQMLREDGVLKASAGLTTIDEVIAATVGDDV